VTEIELLATIVGFLATIAVVIGLFTAHERRHTKAETDLEKLGERLQKVEALMETLKLFTAPELRQAFVDMLLQSKAPKAPGNPYTEEERQRLLRLYEGGTLDLTQAQRLQEIMREEATRATTGGDVVAIVAIIAILIGLGVVIAAMIAASREH
jgi:hypothetical protein